jgi:hypothetical protein
MPKKQSLILLLLITSQHAAAMTDQEQVIKLTEAFSACRARLKKVRQCNYPPEDRGIAQYTVKSGYFPYEDIVIDKTPTEIDRDCRRSCEHYADFCNNPYPAQNCGPNHNLPCDKPDCGFFGKMRCNSACNKEFKNNLKFTAEQCKDIDVKAAAAIEKECDDILEKLNQTKKQ